MENHTVFNSSIFLNFHSPDIENAYQNSRNKDYQKLNIRFQAVTLVLAIIVIVLIALSNYYTDFRVLFCSCAISLVLNLICLLVSTVTSGRLVHKVMIYLSFINSNVHFAVFRLYMMETVQADSSPYSLLIVVEHLFRVVYFTVGVLDFFEGMICFVGVIVLNTVLIALSVPFTYFFRASFFCIMFLICALVIYFLVREKRKSFYFNYTIDKKNQWYQSILENMNSGLVMISDGLIEYVNKTMKNFLKEKDDEFRPQETSGTFQMKIMHLLTKLTVDISHEYELYDEHSYNSLKNVYKYLDNSKNDNSFKYIGKTIFIPSTSNLDSQVFFEVYGRKNFDFNSAYEFLFKDVTRVKQQEEANADFKYKTLFLSKVAHEFKNPILCITELVEQIYDELQFNQPRKAGVNESTVQNILKQIRSISDYMIILIKDLDYFSQKYMDKTKKALENTSFEIEDIAVFCSNIINCLIKKLNKERDISFSVNTACDFPCYVFTDEVKLKQILVNLLSNAVKYTYKGEIVLTIQSEYDNITFHIKDTGKGISEDLMNSLFIPFSREKSHNHISAGLGLYIVKEILEIMGSEIKFKSKVGVGTEFWFTLKNIIRNEDSNSRPSTQSTDEIYDISDDKSINSAFSGTTVVQDFIPDVLNTKVIEDYLQTDVLAKYNNNNNCICNISNLNNNTIIVVDDEILTRKSTIRRIEKFCKVYNQDLNILEASDGIECIYYIYQCYKLNINIKFIISDENMNFINGTYSAEIINRVYESKNLRKIKFYILSAYENMNINDMKGVCKSFTKPLSEKHYLAIYEDLQKE
jgi:signal transduction histidine kinase